GAGCVSDRDAGAGLARRCATHAAAGAVAAGTSTRRDGGTAAAARAQSVGAVDCAVGRRRGTGLDGVAARATNTGAAGIHTGHGCEPELTDCGMRAAVERSGQRMPGERRAVAT